MNFEFAEWWSDYRRRYHSSKIFHFSIWSMPRFWMVCFIILILTCFCLIEDLKFSLKDLILNLRFYAQHFTTFRFDRKRLGLIWTISKGRLFSSQNNRQILSDYSNGLVNLWKDPLNLEWCSVKILFFWGHNSFSQTQYVGKNQWKKAIIESKLSVSLDGQKHHTDDDDVEIDHFGKKDRLRLLDAKPISKLKIYSSDIDYIFPITLSDMHIWWISQYLLTIMLMTTNMAQDTMV